MGAANALAAYALYAGKVPPTSLNVLGYMSLVSLDRDAEPSWWEGHEILAVRCLGRSVPAATARTSAEQAARAAILRAVARAITPLFEAGAVTTARHSCGHSAGVVTVKYRLWLAYPAPDEKRRVEHRAAHDGNRRTQNGGIRRFSSERTTESVAAYDGNRRTKEDEEKEERDHTYTALELTDVEGASTGPGSDQIGIDSAAYLDEAPELERAAS